MGRGRSLARLGYWSYLALGSLVMLILSLIYTSWTLVVLSAVVFGLAIWRLYVLRTDPDE